MFAIAAKNIASLSIEGAYRDCSIATDKSIMPSDALALIKFYLSV